MRNNLNSGAKKITAAFTSNDLIINLACCHVVRAGHIRINEALVMTEIEIGLSTVVGYIYLSMLERIHGPGVHVDVRVEFLNSYPVTSLFKK